MGACLLVIAGCTCLVVAHVVHAAGSCDLQHSGGDGRQVERSQLVEAPVPVRLGGEEGQQGEERQQHMRTAKKDGRGEANKLGEQRLRLVTHVWSVEAADEAGGANRDYERTCISGRRSEAHSTMGRGATAKQSVAWISAVQGDAAAIVLRPCKAVPYDPHGPR